MSPWGLRTKFQIRSASIIVAAEYLWTVRENSMTFKQDHLRPRAVLNSVMVRADEPAELLGYWLARYGRPLPHTLKRALADAALRLYTERNVIKYDSKARTVRMGDVVELMDGPEKDFVLKYLLDERHHGDGVVGLPVDSMLARAYRLEHVVPGNRRQLLRVEPHLLGEAGFTWERLSSWLPGGMDAEAWEFAIPQMGVMALIRNLRNFDKAGISEAAIDAVIDKITGPEDVKASRIWPLHVWAAYREALSDNWARALGRTLELTAPNVPDLSRSLFLVDFSGSMNDRLSGRGTVSRWEVASLMAVAAQLRSKEVDVAVFGMHGIPVTFPAGASALKRMKVLEAKFRANEGRHWYHEADGNPGHATYGHAAIEKLFNPDRHDRVVVFTDDQQADDPSLSRHVPQMVVFDMAGYQPRSIWGGNTLVVGGYSDQAFKVVADQLGLSGDLPD